MPAQMYSLFSSYYFIFFAAFGVMTTLFPIYLGDLGLSNESIGQIMAIGMLASIAGPPIWGFVSDYLHNRPQVILVCQLGAVGASFLLSCSYWYGLLVLFYFGFNFFQAAISPLSDTLVLHNLATSSYGRVRLWGSIGFAAGALLCGQMLTNLLSARIFSANILLGLATLVCVSFFPKTKLVTTLTTVKETVNNVRRLVSRKPFRRLMLILLLVNSAYGAYSSFLGLYLNQLGASRLEIGFAWTIAALVEVPVFALGDKIYRSTRAWNLLALAALLFGVRWVIYGYMTNPTGILLLQVSQSVSFALFYLVSVQLVNAYSPNDLKAIGQTVFGSVGFGLSFALGSLYGGYYAEYFGLHAMFTLSGIVAVAASIIAVNSKFSEAESSASLV